MQSNFPDRAACRRCKARKPAGLDVAAETANQRQVGEHSWREVLDPATQQMYYFDAETNETSWDRPGVMGPAPYATGWFGRGTNESTDR